MKKAFLLIPAVVISLTVSCAKKAVMGEAPAVNQVPESSVTVYEQRIERSDERTNSLELQYHIYRLNQIQGSFKPYTMSAPVFFKALTNEFDAFHMNVSNTLMAAIKGYLSLTNVYTNERGFLLARAAACYYRLSDFASANRLLTRGMSLGYTGDEACYFQAQLLAYYLNDFAGALRFALRANPKYLYVNPQDYYFFVAEMNRLTGANSKAVSAYRQAVSLAPDRFYILYDPIPAFLDMNETGLAQEYCDASFPYLTSLSNSAYRVKAYRQRIELNRALRQPTWSYRFDLPEGYDLSPNLFYFLPNKIYIKRIMSSAVKLPVQEKRENRSDVVYTPTFEDVADFNGGTGYFITAGRMNYTNDLLVKMLGSYRPTSRLYYQTNVALLITPTNCYRTLTNRNLPTNSPYHYTTVVSNGIDFERLKFNYYITTEKCDADGDNTWDFVVLGYNQTNDLVVAVYKPASMNIDYYHFRMTRHDAEIVIQDIDRDGKYDIIALDKDAIILNR